METQSINASDGQRRMVGAGEKRSASHDMVDTKRSRVSLACVGCRRKKERCDGLQPVCGPCSNQNRPCCYASRPKKRGLPAGYVRALEILLGMMFHNDKGSQHSALGILRGTLKVPRIDGDKSTSVITYFADTWRKSSVARELEGLLTSMDMEDDDAISARDLHDKLEHIMTNTLAFRSSPDCEAAGALPKTPSSIAASNFPTAPDPPAAALPVLATPCPLPVPTGPTEPLSPPGTTPATTPAATPADWRRLVDVYYTSTHCWFPVIPRHDILRVAYTLVDNPSRVGTDVSLGDAAVFRAMLAYASYQDCMDLSLRHREQEHVHKASLHTHLLQQALDLALTLQSPLDVGHVQALLILALLRVGQGHLAEAWLLIGRAVYLVVDVSAASLQASSERKPLDTRLHKTYVGCFVLETIIANHLGRRPYLSREDLMRVGLPPIDGIEEWEVWVQAQTADGSGSRQAPSPGRCLSTFNSWVQLVAVLNDLCQIRPGATVRPDYGKMLRDLVPPEQYSTLGQLGAQVAPPAPHRTNLCIAFASTCATLQKKAAGSSPASWLPTNLDQRGGILQRVVPLAKDAATEGFVGMLPLLHVYLHSVMASHINTGPARPQASGASTDELVRSIQLAHNECHRVWHPQEHGALPTHLPPSNNVATTDSFGTGSINTEVELPLPGSALRIEQRLPITSSDPAPADREVQMLPIDVDMRPLNETMDDASSHDLYNALAVLDTTDW